MRMIRGVLRHTSRKRTESKPTHSSCFSEISMLVIRITDDSDTRYALQMHQPHLARVELDLSKVSLRC